MTSSTQKGKGVGVLNCQEITELIETGVIKSTEPISEAQIQPASLDLRLGPKVYRVLSSFLPEKHGVLEKLHTPDMYGADIVMYELDITEPRVLEKGQVYLIPLMESLHLPKSIRARANPKSTTGRLDIFTRVITDRSRRFDDIARAYKGQLFLEVMPRSFAIRVQAGHSLVQLRLTRGKGDYTLADSQLKALHKNKGILFNEEGRICSSNINISKGVFMSVDLGGNNANKIIGYKSKKNSHFVDLKNINYYDIEDFWEPIYKHSNNQTLILEPEEFYIFSSKEKISIPAGYASEMVPFEVGSGELRTHYAGFFDPGFGYGKEGEIKGTKAVLEVRAHDVPFLIADGQTFCKLNFEKMASKPDKLYGTGIGSSYQGQGIKLSKHFKDVEN